jgi:hypothetical protein
MASLTNFPYELYYPHVHGKRPFPQIIPLSRQLQAIPQSGIADCRLPIADCRLPIADCRLPIADYIQLY